LGCQWGDHGGWLQHLPRGPPWNGPASTIIIYSDVINHKKSPLIKDINISIIKVLQPEQYSKLTGKWLFFIFLKFM
jgi:hypothetical protein